MIKIICCGIGTIIATIGAIRYCLAIIKHGKKPRLSSWIAWTISWLALLIIGLKNGSDIIAIMFVAIGLIRSLTVVVISIIKKIKFQVNDIIDVFSLVTAVSCALVIALFNSDSLTVVVAATANFIATIPTLIQAWKHPKTDSPAVFIGNTISCLLTITGLVLIQDIQFSSMTGPLVSLVGNLSTVAIMGFRGHLNKLRHGFDKGISHLHAFRT